MIMHLLLALSTWIIRLILPIILMLTLVIALILNKHRIVSALKVLVYYIVVPLIIWNDLHRSSICALWGLVILPVEVCRPDSLCLWKLGLVRGQMAHYWDLLLDFIHSRIVVREVGPHYLLMWCWMMWDTFVWGLWSRDLCCLAAWWQVIRLVWYHLEVCSIWDDRWAVFSFIIGWRLVGAPILLVRVLRLILALGTAAWSNILAYIPLIQDLVAMHCLLITLSRVILIWIWSRSVWCIWLELLYFCIFLLRSISHRRIPFGTLLHR